MVSNSAGFWWKARELPDGMLTSIIGIGLNVGSGPRRVRADGWPAASLQDVLPAGQPLPEISELARLVASRVEHRLADLHRVVRRIFMPLGPGWCSMVHLGPKRTRRPLSDRRGKIQEQGSVGRAGHPSRRQVIALRGARFRCGV